VSISLRRRAILGGLVWAALAFVGAGITLYQVMDGVVVRRFDQNLGESLLQLTASLSSANGDTALISTYMADPAYARPYSGHYWQAEGQNGAILSSRSLFDVLLDADPAELGEKISWQNEGPDGIVRGLSTRITLENGDEWLLSVANSLADLQSERNRIRDSLALAFGILGVLGVIAAALLTSISLQPLDRLRADVTNRWNSGKRLLPADYPEEVAPLVADLNDVLDRNTEILDRARRRAADMAHALNTPVAIMRNELGTLKQNGVDVERSQEALERIESQIARSLARIRAANSSESTGNSVPVAASLDRLRRAFRQLIEDDSKVLDVVCDERIEVFMDRQDLEEALGNMLDNALKWCRSKVMVRATALGNAITIFIDDDGPGIPEIDRREALRAGGRLDHAKPGTGLGLAIVSDLAQAYGGALELTLSAELNGLCAALSLPGRYRAL
jgi:signal transduction histidine kinase